MEASTANLGCAGTSWFERLVNSDDRHADRRVWHLPCFAFDRPRIHTRTKPMSSKRSSRRQFLRHAGAGLLAVPLARPALAQTKARDVTLRLDWVYQGPNAGFMVAQDKGFYAQAGLNVDVGPGKGSGNT